MTPFHSPPVAATFAGYPAGARKKLMRLRELIFAVAKATPNVGEIEETLKWGEPAYVTAASKSGSTIRIAWKKSMPKQYAMYFICTTTLVAVTFRTRFPQEFQYEGSRAIVFDLDHTAPEDALRFCIAAALAYHQK
jgi:Domain of unknown function (DU1801)